MNDFTLTDPNAVADPYSDASTAARATVEPAVKPVAVQPDPRQMVTTAAHAFGRGRVALDPDALRGLRHSRMLSQQDLADDCWRRNIRVSIATIKRAECGQAVRFRIVRELARCFEVPVERLLRAD